ncbi:MAG: DnaA regulatory inactivator Hda [Gammaproteobacteria bacterium]
MSGVATPQLALRLGFPDAARFGNFVAGTNAEALATLQAVAAGAHAGPIYLWGEPGCGRSHLLQAACAAADARGAGCGYVPLASVVRELPPAMLDGLDELDLVCVDDLDAAAGDEPWQEALLHLYNRRRDRHRALVLAGRFAPAAMPLALADLRTRLGWGPVFRIAPADDAAMIEALAQRARGRGLELPEPVARYLLSRCRREMGALLAQLDQLDAAALAAQRALTVPFVRAWLDQAPR